MAPVNLFYVLCAVGNFHVVSGGCRGWTVGGGGGGGGPRPVGSVRSRLV